MVEIRWDAGMKRFRHQETVRNDDGSIRHRRGEIADPNDVIRKERVTRDEHGWRLNGRFIPKSALRQSRRTRPGAVQRDTDPPKDAIRLVAVGPDGNVHLIRAAAYATRDQDTGEIRTEATLNQAKIVAAEALEIGLISEDEYSDLTQGAGNDARDALDLIKSRAEIVQDPMDLRPSKKLKERVESDPQVRL